MQRLLHFPRYRLSLHMLPGILVFALLLIGAIQSPITYASGGASFTLRPATSDPANPLARAYFILSGRPGIVLQNSIVVTNTGTGTGTVSLYAVDAGTGQNSGLIYLQRNAPRTDVGAWIQLSASQVTLTAGQSKAIPFQVLIPGKVRAGQHVGGIVAESVQQDTSTKNNKLHITVHSRLVMAVEVNLPGPQVEQLTANGIQVGGSDNYEILEVGLSNTGTTLLKAAGSLQVIDSKDKPRQHFSLSLDSFLPGTSITYPTYVQKTALGVGTYNAELLLKYGHGHVLNYTTQFTITDRQIIQIFNKNTALSFPGLKDSVLSKLSPLQLFGGAFVVLLIVLLIVLYWTKKLYRVTVRVAQGNQQNTAKKRVRKG